MKNKHQCPNCQSYNVSSSRDAWKWVLCLGILSSWLFGFGIILIIASIPLKFILAKKPEQLTCMNCRFKF